MTNRQFSKTRGNLPKLVGSIPYTYMTASATSFMSFLKCLDRNAIARTFMFKNTTDVTVNSIVFTLIDSFVSNGSTTPSTTLVTSLASGVNDYSTSEQYPELYGHVDGIDIGVSMGATAPTRGTLDIYVVELF